MRDVAQLTGLSKSYLYQLSANNQFPKSIQLVPGGVSTAWIEGEVIDWMDSRIADRVGLTNSIDAAKGVM